MNMQKRIASDYLCAALDGLNIFDPKEMEQEIKNRLSAYKGNVAWVKIGMEAFYASYGIFDILALVKEYGFKIFLDLKLKDIGKDTIKNSSAVLTTKGVDIFNVHADGMEEMMKLAVEGINIAASKLAIEKPKIIAVTVLTSMDDNDLKKLGVNRTVKEQVLFLAKLAASCEFDGIVSSALELDVIRHKLPQGFFYVNPGIRLADEDSTGQKRIATPDLAIENGSSLLVVGRPFYENLSYEQQAASAEKYNQIVTQTLEKMWGNYARDIFSRRI